MIPFTDWKYYCAMDVTIVQPAAGEALAVMEARFTDKAPW